MSAWLDFVRPWALLRLMGLFAWDVVVAAFQIVAVIITGRSRRSAPRRTASASVMPPSRS